MSLLERGGVSTTRAGSDGELWNAANPVKKVPVGVRRFGFFVCSGLLFGAAGCDGGGFSASEGATGGAAGTDARTASNGGTTAAGGSAAGGGDSSSGGAGGTITGVAGGSGGTPTAAGGAKPGNPDAGPGNGGTSGGGTGNGGTGNGGTGNGGAAMADAAPPRWCDGRQVLFCEDFDGFATVDELLNSWTNFSTVGAAFTFDTSAGVPSPPSALRVRTMARSGVQALAVRKIDAFTTRPTSIRLEFALRIDAGDTVDPVTGAAFAGFLTGTRVTDGIVGIKVGPGPALLAGYVEPNNGPANDTPLPSVFPTENQWLGRYGIEVTYANVAAVRSACLQILVGGTRQLPQCLKLPASLVDPAFVSVALGVYSGGVGATGDVQLRFDNVTMTAQYARQGSLEKSLA
jgi:hypothetical protein